MAAIRIKERKPGIHEQSTAESERALLAALKRAFPGMTPARRHMREIHIEPVRLQPGVDAVAMLIEDRGRA